MNSALKGNNVLLLKLAHTPCHTTLESLSEHLVYMCSSLETEMGIKKVKVEVQCSGWKFRVFILSKFITTSTLSPL